MGEAIAGHEMENHLGSRIRVTARTLATLRVRNYLRRNRATGLLQIKPSLYPVFRELEREDLKSRVYREIGPDCSGAAAVVCKCRDCQWREADLDYTRLSDEHNRVQVDEAIRSVRAQRR